MTCYRGHFVSREHPYSFPVCKPDEGLYQVLQPLLQKHGQLAKPEVYAALADDDPSSIVTFFGISFVASQKYVDLEALTKLRQSYNGEEHTVSPTHENLVFRVATLMDSTSALQFVAAAFIQMVEITTTGHIRSIVLDTCHPYFLFYFVTPRVPVMADFDLELIADKMLDFGVVTSAEDIHPLEVVNRVNFQIINTVRNYMLIARASSGDLCGLRLSADPHQT